jgi:Serine/threonine protein kinase
MRHTTKIGHKMRGGLRPCIPPESVFSSSLATAPSTDRMKTISFDEDFNKTKAIKYSVSLDDEFPALEFIPENCIADPSWDIFSFGLVMGQLILGQSMVLLPNFERAEDAHLKKLYQFDHTSLRKIEVAARKVISAKAANLLIKCLQPIPEDRPSNMDEILRHPYFDDINTI